MTVNRGIQIGFAVVAAAIVALVIALVLTLGGGDDGSSAGGEPASPATEAPGGLPADLLECLEEQGVDPSQLAQLGTGVPPGPEVHEALPACAQFLPEGAGPPGGYPGAP